MKLSNVTQIRMHVIRVLLSCETLEQINLCEEWYLRLINLHPKFDFQAFHEMFIENYKFQRKMILKKEGQND